MKQNKPLLIKCPHCGAEYLPAEIYIPTDFLPKCKDVVKDASGKFITCSAGNMNTAEEYTCDYCGHRFTVEAMLTFDTSINELHDYNYDYSSPLYSKDRMELPEN